MGGFDSPYSYEFNIEAMEGAAAVILVFYLLLLFALLAFTVVAYVLQSLSFYTVAKRRGINNPWLAWIPFGVVWILGSISDQYQYLVKGKVKNRRKILLGIAIAYAALVSVLYIGLIISAFSGMPAVMLIMMLLFYIAVIAFLIPSLIFQYMCYFDFYQSCDPDKAVLYFVLSLVISVTAPFFLFVCRKKDLGMPPKKAAVPAAVPAPAAQESPAAAEMPAPAAEETPVPEELPAD